MILKKLLPHQAALVQAPYLYPEIRFFFLTAGYAAGKSSALTTAIQKAVTYFAGCKDGEGNMPRIIVGGISLTFLTKTVVGSFVQSLQNSKTDFKYNKVDNIVTVAGVEVMFIAVENPDTIFGYDACCAFIDELDELPTWTSQEVVRSVNDRCRQIINGKRPPFTCYTSTSQGLKGMYQTIMEFEKSGIGYIRIKARTRDNTYLSPDYIKSMYAIYNEKETQCLLEGEFVSIESGRVFPDYDPVYNMLEYDLYDMNYTGTVYVGADFNTGFNKASACIINNNNIVQVKEYCFPDWRSAPEVLRYDFPRAKIYIIPDMTSKDKFGEFKKHLRQYNVGLILRKSNPRVEDRVFAINKMFFLQRLFLCPMCKESSEDLLKHENDKKTGKPMKGASISAPDHRNDAFSYVVSYLLSNHREFLDVYKVTLGFKFNRKVNTDEEGKEISEKEAYGGKLLNTTERG